MDDNTKFSIREYREVLYNEISKKRKNSQFTNAQGVLSVSEDDIKKKERDQQQQR
jgi:hypothetical protein